MRVQTSKDPQIITLINAVRCHSALYDYRQEKHRDEAYKQSIWEEIAQTCNMKNAADAKTLWCKLHYFFMNCYRNELIRLVRANYSEAAVGPLPQEAKPDCTVDESLNDDSGTWSYYSEMRFVAPFRDKSSDSELERLIQLAKPLVLRMDLAKRTLRPRLLAKNGIATVTPTPKNTDAAANEIATDRSTGTVFSEVAADAGTVGDETAAVTVGDETAAVTTTYDAESLPVDMDVEITHFDAATQTTTESVHLDIPPIKAEILTPQEQSLRSFFDAMFRATCALPAPYQRKMKRTLLETLHNCQVWTDTE